MTGNAKSSGYDRDPHDWYVEDRQSVVALFEAVSFGDTPLHDPCCGGGNIPDVAASLGINMTGADLVDRASGKYPTRDFLHDASTYTNIVTNPPFKIAVPIIHHAIKHVAPGGRVAALVQAKFLFSQTRQPLFEAPETESVFILSRRPSMPPGELLAAKGEACRGGGFHDFLWVVWRRGKTDGGASIEWLL